MDGVFVDGGKRAIWALCLLVWAPLALAAPRIAIIIDDLGHDLEQGRRAIGLPAAVTCAFLPGAPYSISLAESAFGRGKEIMLHLPMDSVDDRPLGPDGLTVGMTREQFMASLYRDLDAIPHIRGVNNHMGSLLTQLPDDMSWLMRELRRRGLYFIDSRTTRATVAQRIAQSFGLATERRNLFLDNIPTKAAIDRQFDKLLRMARRRGRVIAIGHPYPETMAVLEGRLSRLGAETDIEVVSVSDLLMRQAPGGTPDLMASRDPVSPVAGADRSPIAP